MQECINYKVSTRLTVCNLITAKMLIAQLLNAKHSAIKTSMVNCYNCHKGMKMDSEQLFSNYIAYIFHHDLFINFSYSTILCTCSSINIYSRFFLSFFFIHNSLYTKSVVHQYTIYSIFT